MWMKLYDCLIVISHIYKNYAAVLFSFEFNETLNRVLAYVNYEFQRKESVPCYWLEGAVSYCKHRWRILWFKKN